MIKYYFFSLSFPTYRKHIKKHLLDKCGTYEHTETCTLKLILVQNTIISHCSSWSITFVTEEFVWFLWNWVRSIRIVYSVLRVFSHALIYEYFMNIIVLAMNTYNHTHYIKSSNIYCDKVIYNTLPREYCRVAKIIGKYKTRTTSQRMCNT